MFQTNHLIMRLKQQQCSGQKLSRQAYKYLFILSFTVLVLWPHNCIGLIEDRNSITINWDWNLPYIFLLTSVKHNCSISQGVTQFHRQSKQITQSKPIMHKYNFLSHSATSHKPLVWVKNTSWTSCSCAAGQEASTSLDAGLSLHLTVYSLPHYKGHENCSLPQVTMRNPKTFREVKYISVR